MCVHKKKTLREIAEDTAAICETVRKKGDIAALAKEREIEFVKPMSIPDRLEDKKP